MQDLIAQIRETVIAGRHREIEALVAQSLKQGLNADELINRALIAAMDTVGSRFAKGEIFVPEMLVAAKTMKMGLEIVKPLLLEGADRSRSKIILCTVKGDLHDIGKNLVAMMLEGAGFDVVDLGVNTAAEIVLQKIAGIRPDIVGLSALLTTTLPEMKRVIEEMARAGMREKVKVMVGGAPVDEKFAREIGADAYGRDAAEAVVIARSFMPRP